MFFQKHWTFSKIPRDVFFKTTVSFFSGFYPIFYTKKGCIKTFFLTQPFCYYFAERQALEPILSRNIIKLQITDNHILSKV